VVVDEVKGVRLPVVKVLFWETDTTQYHHYCSSCLKKMCLKQVFVAVAAVAEGIQQVIFC
jgi:hypothetical protein